MIQFPDTLKYLAGQFDLRHLERATLGHSLQIHLYRLGSQAEGHRLPLAERYGADTAGVAQALGLKASPQVELQKLVTQLQKKLSLKPACTSNRPVNCPTK